MAHSRVAARFREPDGLVHHAHGLAHLGERGLGDLVGAAVALAQDVLDVVHILHEPSRRARMGAKYSFTLSVTYFLSWPEPPMPMTST